MPPHPLARPFLMPSGAAPADALLATFPMDTTPLTLATPPPSEEGKDPRRVFEPRSGQLRALSKPSRAARLMMITRIARYSQW